MITYKDLFGALKQDSLSVGKAAAFDIAEYNRAHQMLIHLCHAEIVQYNAETKLFSLHPKQIKPSAPIIVVDIPPKVAPVPKTVHVNWSRGFSGAKYPVLGYGVSQMLKHEGERYYLINNSTDENKTMIKRVWAKDCQAGIEKVAIVEAKAA